MALVRAGDRVRIADRTADNQDHKTGLFYNHYRGLTGVVQKAYKSREVAVEIDQETLPEDVWRRHMQARDQMRNRWLDGLPADARRKLTPDQKTFDLRYVVLVSTDDLKKVRPPR
jgi:hypothetical protein